MRPGFAYRYVFNAVNLSVRSDGWLAGARTAVELLGGELKVVPAQLRARRLPDGRPALPTEPRPEVDMPTVRAQLAGAGLVAKPHRLDPEAFSAHQRRYRYPRFYAGGSVASGGAREWKLLEYFVTLALVPIAPDDVVVDVASQRSLFPDVVRRLYGARAYRQDLVYPPVFAGDKIGGSAAQMPVEAGFADALVLQNSFEHFEESADTEFVTEAWRVLKPGGVVCIVPIYISQRYEILTDPLLRVPPLFDPGAAVVRVAGYRNRFGRFYSVEALVERVLEPARRVGFACELFDFENVRELEAGSGLYFGLLLVKPRALPAAAELRDAEAAGGGTVLSDGRGEESGEERRG